MSIIKPFKPEIERRRRRALEDAEAKKDRELSKKEVKALAIAGIGGLGFLFLVAWLLLPLSAKIIPFVVAGALPLFTLFAVIYQAIVYRRQWNVMQESLQQTRLVITKMQTQITAANNQTEVLKKALIESEKMTAHTEASIVIAQSGIEHAQRAYVTVVKREWGHNAFVLTVENSGNTPAREVSIDAVVKLGYGSFETTADITGQYRPLGLLTPHGKEVVAFEFDTSIPEADLPYYTDQQSGFHWYCNGYIMYRDIFQKDLGDYWVIKFCFYFDQFKEVIRAESSGNEIEEYRNGKQVRGKPSLPY